MIAHQGSSPQLFRSLPVVALAVLSMAACKTDVEPTPALSIHGLTSQLVALSGGDSTANQAEKSIRDLAEALARVMAKNGGTAPPLGPGIAPISARLASPAPVLGYLLATPERVGRPALDGGADFEFGPEVLPPVALGKTCIWNEITDKYKGGTDLFGPVPLDGTNFELYRTQNKLPVRPLQTLGTYTQIRAFKQADPVTNPNDISVGLFAAPIGASPLTTVLLTGKTNANGGPLDVLMTGGAKAGGGTPLDYILSVNNDRSSNQVRAADVLIVATIDAAGTQTAVKFLVQQRATPREGLDFQFTLSSTGAISGGNVYVGSEQVATMVGDRLAPVFSAKGAQLANFDDLTKAYLSVLLIDGRINTLFFIGHCVGAENPVTCALMTRALGH